MKSRAGNTFCKGPESILGFANQEARPKDYYVGCYITREKKLAQIFIDKIQNIITIVYNFPVTQACNKNGITLGGISFHIIGVQSLCSLSLNQC